MTLACAAHNLDISCVKARQSAFIL